jgi:alanine racemase
MQGSIFFALKGTQADGHEFVAKALANGAVAAVVERGRIAQPEEGAIIEVDNPLEALQRLAKWWRSELSATVVAVVGGTGKTVTKDALVHILGYGARVFGSPGSFNSKIGVPLGLLDCPRDSDIAVIEAAASRPGEMKVLHDVIRPHHVIFTNLGSRHTTNFETREDQVREFLAMEAGRADGWLLTGDQQPMVQAMAKAMYGSRLRSRGDLECVPVFQVMANASMSTFINIRFPGGVENPAVIQTPFDEIIFDAELAVAASWLLGVGSETVMQAISEYLPTATRMEVWQSPKGWTVVRDVATTDAVTLEQALRVSHGLATKSSRFTVVLADPLTSCGDDSIRALGRAISASAVDTLYMLDCATHRGIRDVVAKAAPEIGIPTFASLEAMRPALITRLGRDDVVLIESPRERSLAEVASTLIEPMAATRLYIDETALESNIIAFRRLIGPGVQLLAMVKGLAYGSSPVQVSKLLQAAGVDQLGVATADEGAAIRQAGISLPILVTLGTPGEMDKMIRYTLTPQIYSPNMLDSAIADARESGRRQPLDIHLEIDTGMHRTGFLPADAVDVLHRLREQPMIRLAGLMTHFACADMPEEDAATRSQMETFMRVATIAEELGFKGFTKHMANTAGCIRFPEARLDAVRIGLGLYGIHPSPATAPYINLTPVAGLVSKVVEIQELGKDERIGYGGTYRVPDAGRRVAVVAAGYHDCVPRAFSNFGYVAIDGRKCPIVGVVSMDSMVVDVSDCPGAEVGSDVLIYGRYGGSQVPIAEVAAAIGTIPYELLARVGPRVERVLTHH